PTRRNTSRINTPSNCCSPSVTEVSVCKCLCGSSCNICISNTALSPSLVWVILPLTVSTTEPCGVGNASSADTCATCSFCSGGEHANKKHVRKTTYKRYGTFPPVIANQIY